MCPDEVTHSNVSDTVMHSETEADFVSDESVYEDATTPLGAHLRSFSASRTQRPF